MRLILGALLTTLVLFVASASAQVTGRILSTGFAGDYRPGCWTPMVIGLTPNGSPTGFYEIRVWQHDLDGDTPYYATRVSLTGSAGEQPFWTYFIPEPIHEGLTTETSTSLELAQRLRITIHDAAGKELAQVPLGNATMRSVELGPPPGSNAPARPWRFVLFVGTNATPVLGDYDQSRIVGIKENLAYAKVNVDDLPENVIGYDAIDAVVWLGGDPATLLTGGGAKLDALREYVRNGGHLVITTPANWQQLTGFDDLMPVDIQGVEANTLQSPLRDITARMPYPEGVEGLPRENPWRRYRSPQMIAAATLRPGAVVDEYSDRVAEPTDDKDRTPWLVRRAYGFGCVSWVAQDLGNRELLDRANWGWPAVWEEVLGTPTGGANTPIVDGKRNDKRRFEAGGRREFGFAVLDAMNLTGRGAKLVSVTILFFIAYWALAGPGTFFYLKFRRRATLSWFAFGALAMLATAVTLGLTKLLLRGKPEVKHISLVRAEADRNRPSLIRSSLGMYIPRDGAQKIEIPAINETASGVPPTITPFPIHPLLHQKREGDKYLFAAPREYRIPVPTDESARTVVVNVPFRTTMKRLQAEWSGGIDDRIEGGAALQPSVSNVGYISGTLKNLTGHDLRNVYVAFRHQPPGGRPQDWMMFVWQWKAGESLDLAVAFNPAGEQTPTDITVGGEKNVAPNPKNPVRGWLSQWVEFYAPQLRPASLGFNEIIPVADFDAEVPMSVPILSFYNRLPIIPNQSNGQGGFDVTRSELNRSGLRQWDMSNALMAGKLVVVAEADDTALPLPLEVDGDKVIGTGKTIYQFVLPLQPIAEKPTTKPTTRTSN